MRAVFMSKESDFPGGISIRETESLWDEFGWEVGLFLRAWKA